MRKLAVFRAERTGNFTIMSNGHLRDRALSLKAKGLLSLMLSLPEGWSYSVRGLAAICREGVEAVTSALRELEGRGYVVRRRTRGPGGRIGPTEYVIRERPEAAPVRQNETGLRQNETQPPEAAEGEDAARERGAAMAVRQNETGLRQNETQPPEMPDREKPDTARPGRAGPGTGIPPQRKREEARTEQKKTEGFWIGSDPLRAAGWDGTEEEDPAQIRRQVMENLEYRRLCQVFPNRQEELDGLVELVVEVLCARRRTTRVAGADFPHRMVQERFRQLESPHVEYVLDSLQRSTSQVRNVKQYLLAALFNAPATMEGYYAAQVNRDLYGDPGR